MSGADGGPVCPNCGALGMRTFFAVDQVPVHSVLLMPTYETAVGFPRGDVRLSHCAACGFVANTAFDVGMNAYSTEYEETQGFSPTFNAFVSSIS